MIEPIHILGARTTANSQAEGRLKLDVSPNIRKKRKIVKKKLANYIYKK